MSDHLPEINTLVTVRIDGVEYPSRVEDADDRSITVAAPQGGALERPADGSSTELCWSASGRGRFVVPVRLVEVVKGTPWGWRVEATDTVDREQRRRYVRGGGGERMRLAFTGDSGSKAVNGYVIDIGEGGLRCRFSMGDLSEDQLPAGQEVEVTVDLDDRPFTVPGTVLRMIPQGDRVRVDAVIAFDLDETHAGLVRRYVIQRELLARKAAADATH